MTTSPDAVPASGPSNGSSNGSLDEGGVSIAEAARLVGLSAHTLRYYERDGLLIDDIPRGANGHRRYSAREIEWVELVSRLRATGMPIHAIREFAELVRQGVGNESDRLTLLYEHRSRIEAQLEEVKTHLGAINHKITVYEG